MINYLFICPTPGSEHFKVTLWAVVKSGSEVEVLRSPEADWTALSTSGVVAALLDDSALGHTDACLARGEIVSHRLDGPPRARLGADFECAETVPPDLRCLIDALSDIGQPRSTLGIYRSRFASWFVRYST